MLALGLRQPSVSKHLGVLREAGLVSVSKQGQQRVYELNLDPLRPVYDWVKTFEQHWERQLDRIKAKAERRALALRNSLPNALSNALSNASERTASKKGTS